jgi:hypothetical protein
MKKIAVLILMLAAVPAAAYEITADSLIAAHSMGAPTEQILRQMADPTNTMVQPTAADAERMKSAGVPPSVMGALASGSPGSASGPPVANSAAIPDNPRLAEVVRLVDSGLAEQLIEEQIMQQGLLYRPTINDLIYLKENNVSEGVIAALMTAELLSENPAAKPAAENAGGLVVDGLVLKGGMMSFGGTRSGQLTLAADTLEWRDSEDQSKAMDLSVIAIKSITARCRARSSSDFCYEVEFDLAKGSSFVFEDARQKYGGNNAIVLLLAGLESQYPDTPVKSKVKGR